MTENWLIAANDLASKIQIKSKSFMKIAALLILNIELNKPGLDRLAKGAETGIMTTSNSDV
jgi:hypothetical protein